MIYLIITTSINNKIGPPNAEHRQLRYTECIRAVLKLVENDPTIKPIIVENNGKRKTFLDDLQCDVVYTTNNKISMPHKGVNELMDIKEVIKQYKIQDDDMIIKLTGRYNVKDLSFFDLVKKNEYDAFVKFFNVCTLQYLYNDCVLGLFAIKAKHLNAFNYSCKKSGEVEFAKFIRDNIILDKIMEIKQLNLECCFADDLRMLHV